MVTRRRNTEATPTAWLHRFLGKQLLRYRNLAGKTQAEMAAVAHVSTKHYCAFELAERMPSRDTIEVLDHALDARGALVAIRDELVEPPNETWFDKLKEMEQQAAEIWQYEVQVMPGLLQTEGYARAVLESAPRQKVTRTVEEDLAVRMRRQELLTRAEAPDFLFVLDGAVLLRTPGDPRVLADQLQHLLRVAELPNVTLQVIPLERGWHSMLSGPTTLLKFDYGADDVVYVEPNGQGLLSYDPVTVRYITRRLDLLRSEALSGAESIKLIRSRLEST